jgi:hypothetical protein
MRGRSRARRLTGAVAGAALFLACGGGPYASPYYGASGPPFVSPEGYSLWHRVSALGGGTPAQRLILIGDAGQSPANQETLADVGRWSLPDRTTVVYLGDNLYPRGLGKHDERGEAILLQQLRATPAKKLFVPGNHDWGDPWPDAATLLREQQFVDAFSESPARFLPEGGCPGPALETVVEAGAGLARGVVLMAIDLDWWLMDPDDRPACPGIGSESDFVSALARALHEHAADNVIVVAHHPLRTGGPHGGHGRGFFGRLGLDLADALGIRIQDVDADVYRHILHELKPVLAAQTPFAYASGHDHGLQVLEGRGLAGTLIVSGAGAAGNVTTVTAIAGTLFAHASAGFAVLDFYAEGEFGDAVPGDRVMLRVIEAGRARPVFEMELPQR